MKTMVDFEKWYERTLENVKTPFEKYFLKRCEDILYDMWQEVSTEEDVE